MTIQDTLKKTPLYDAHISLKARMVPFGGWAMPVQYEGILAEYTHTRQAAAIFDTSHMGEFIVDGDCQASGLNRIVTMRVEDMPLKSCRYGMMLNECGGVIDDLIVFREDAKKWFIVVNGAITSKDAGHFQEQLKDGAIFQDISAGLGKIDVQGPASREILEGFAGGIKKLEYYTFDYFNLLGHNVRISRTGYTGELGFEIYCPWEATAELWQELLKVKGVTPAGLGARDMLRLEVGYSLYGHELGEDITPLEAGLERFVDFEKDFTGKAALLKQKKAGVERKAIGFMSRTRRSPREGQKIYAESGEEIGVVTSGTFSPACQKGIGMGIVRAGSVRRNAKIFFGNDKIKNDAIMAGRIFYKDGSLKN